MVNNKFAHIRKDLIKAGLSVPVGDLYYSSEESLIYRWKNDYIFEVFFNKKWQIAESIDWEFDNLHQE